MPNAVEEELGAFVELRSNDSSSEELIERICVAYRYSVNTFGGYERTGQSQWTEINSRKQEIHNALLSGRGVSELFQDPSSTNFFEGYDNNFVSEVKVLKSRKVNRDFQAALAYEGLERLMQALGLMRIRNPEALHRSVKTIKEADDMIQKISDSMDFEIIFPNVFPNEYGLNTRHGILNIRSVYALHQACATRNLLLNADHKSVVEIGAGIGRAAYFCSMMNVKDYTIIDLPLTNATQAYFLGMTLGPENITLSGEKRSGSLKILTPASLSENSPNVGIVTCVDALTEMENQTAENYVRLSSKIADVFYTVNHEVNFFTAAEVLNRVCPKAMKLHYINYVRPGYVEDVLFMRSSGGWTTLLPIQDFGASHDVNSTNALSGAGNDDLQG